jgi:hypothetical protein
MFDAILARCEVNSNENFTIRFQTHESGQFHPIFEGARCFDRFQIDFSFAHFVAIDWTIVVVDFHVQFVLIRCNSTREKRREKSND